MGGVIIFLAIMIPVLLFARLDNVYVIIMLIATIWMFIIGFIDDYIKVFKKSKAGLHGKFKILGQDRTLVHSLGYPCCIMMISL